MYNEYEIIGGKWVFQRDQDPDHVIESDSISIIFEQDREHDTLIKHGDSLWVEKLLHSGRYDPLIRMGSTLVLFRPRKEDVEEVNKCINISATKRLTQLYVMTKEVIDGS